MEFTVDWKVNDGKDGYPNIMSIPRRSIQKVRSYRRAILYHAAHNEVSYLPGGPRIEEIARGKSRAPYRDFEVTYRSKSVEDYPVTKTIRVYFKR